MIYCWDTKVRHIKTIGPQRSRELNKIGFETVGDLLEKHPLSYIFPGVIPIKDARDGQIVIRAKIKEIKHGWGSTITAVLDDGTTTCEAIWYTSYAIRQLRSGVTATFYGKMSGGTLQQPKWTCVPGGMSKVCGGQYGEVHHRTIRAALVEVLATVELPEMYGGISRVKVFRAFHFPKDKAEQARALQTLKFDEALCLALALQERRRGREQYTVQPMRHNNHYFHAEIMSHFPYDFTDDQTDAVEAVIDDMTKTVPTQRLIHGEVGSGKSAVAFYAAMLAALNGKRALILCPTTILAAQHYDNLKGLGWDDVYLHGQGGTPPMPHIVIGTHSLLHDPMVLREAHLVVIDEFQKFGVAQRAQAAKYNPHLLLMSATPIPRTLAATVFGDLDVSVIRELPIKRGTVITKWVLPSAREAMYEIIEKELAKGHQAYIVYPRISGDEDVVSAGRGFSEINYWFDMYRVKLLTGRASAEDKAEVLHEFYQGDTQILVSTIIAEVGLDNPNATVMVIEGADRFGLSQLHQLRGRVCRSTDTTFCFLVSETANPTSIARLEVIERTNDGFEIAEEDLRLRGCGEIFSTKQTGLPALNFISLVDDFDLMQEAKELVQSGSVGDGPKEMVGLKYEGLLQFGGVV